MDQPADGLGHDRIAAQIIGRFASNPAAVVRLTGPPGIGKTWIAGMVADIWRRRDGGVLVAPGDDAAAGRPLHPFLVSLIDQSLNWRAIARSSGHGAITTAEKLLGAPGGGGSLFDVLATALDQKFERATRPLSGAERSIVLDFRRLLRKRPILLVADNAHWWDGNSIALLTLMLSPRLREAVPELRRLSVLLVDTLNYQAATDAAGYDRLIRKADTLEEVPRIDRGRFPEALRAVGLSMELPDDVLDLLFAATGAHLKLCQQLVDLIQESSPERIAGLAESDLVTAALRHRLEGLGVEGSRVADLLAAASLIGLRFNLDQLACLTSSPIDEVRDMLERAEAASLVAVTPDAATFAHDLLRGFFQRQSAGEERRRRLGQLARCVALLRPSDYELRAQLLAQAGDAAASRDAYALAAIRRLRDGVGLVAVERDLRAVGVDDEPLLAFVRDLAEAYRLVSVGDHRTALRVTAAPAPDDTEVMAAERAYVAGLCWMEQQTAEGFLESRTLLSQWRERLTAEAELQLRFGLLLQQALVLSDEFDAARAVEKQLYVELSRRAAYDPDAARALQVQNRRAAGINSSEIAEARIRRAVAYFEGGPTGTGAMIDLYKAQTNHAAILLALARDAEALVAARSAEQLVVGNPEVTFPRRDVLAHNLNIAGYRTGAWTITGALERQRQVVSSPDGQADNFLQRCALGALELLSGDVEAAAVLANALQEEVEVGEIVESYLCYYAGSLQEAVALASRDWLALEKAHAHLAPLVRELRWTSASFVRRRHALVGELIAARDPVDELGAAFDEALTIASPIEIGPAWRHYGRLAPMCDLAFWSDD